MPVAPGSRPTGVSPQSRLGSTRLEYLPWLGLGIGLSSIEPKSEVIAGMEEPKHKPRNVPSEAEWNPDEKQWELGGYHPSGTRLGKWRHWWYETGHLCAESEYSTEFLETYVRYHPDGTWSHRGSLHCGYYDGVYELQKSTAETTELALTDKPSVFRARMHLEGQEVFMEEYFTEQGVRIDVDGEPLTEPADFFESMGPEVPDALSGLLFFEYSVGPGTYSQSFHLASAASRPGLFIFGADDTGTVYALWQVGALSDSPVVAIHDSCACVVSVSIQAFVRLLCYDSIPAVEDTITYGRDRKQKGYKRSPKNAALHNFATRYVGVDPIVNIRTVRNVHNAAVERFGAKFRDFWAK